MSAQALWLIIVVNGTASGVAGPVPYDMARCMELAAEGAKAFEAVPENRLGFQFICERRDDRLELGERYQAKAEGRNAL